MLNNKTILATILAGGLSLSGNAMAYGGHAAGWNGYPGPGWGQVLKVRPVFDNVRVAYPYQVCNGRSGGHNSATPEIFGAIVGAAVGNQFGSGRGKRLATAAGAVAGASVAHDIDHRRDAVGRGCWTDTRYRVEKHIVGYRVNYRYNGRVYRTRVVNQPGRWIRAARRHALLH
jgi:uncharacterized protein YcfJ